MSIRTRKLIGAFALLHPGDRLGAGRHGDRAISADLQTTADRGAYYVVAGIGWVLPAMPLINWMSGTADQVTLIGRKPFHSAVAAPDTSTRA